MAKYHINSKGEPGACTAAPGNCPFGENTQHYETAEAAREAYEARNDGQTFSVAKKQMRAETKAAISYDPLAEAESFTGVSYKEEGPGGEATQLIALGLMAKHQKDKQALLEAAGDTHMSQPYGDVLAIYMEQGFEEVSHESWAIEHSDPQEDQTVLWNEEEGLLAVVNSYRGKSNGSKVYFNWRPTDQDNAYAAATEVGRLSGGFARVAYDRGDKIWTGDFDARDGLVSTLDEMRESGTFLPQWSERPHMWLVNPAEERASGLDRLDQLGQINDRKLAQLNPTLLQKLGDSTWPTVEAPNRFQRLLKRLGGRTQ